MEIGKLTVDLRTDTGKGFARRLRNQGLVPGICYGAKLETPLMLTLSPKALKQSLDPLKRQNTVLTLDVQQNGATQTTVTAMLKEYQIHPIRRDVMHIDLVAIEADKKVEAEVPVEITGKAVGVAVGGGQLRVSHHSVMVSCKPADIPTKFVADVTELDIGHILRVGDLNYPEGVTPTEDPKLPIVTCVATAAEEEAKPEDAEAETAAADEGDKGDKAKGDKDKGGGDAKK